MHIKSPAIKGKGYEKIMPEKSVEQFRHEKEMKMPLKWVDDITSDSGFIDFEQLCDNDFVLLLLDLLLYDHKDLVKLSFELLKMHFSQKKLLIENLQDIQLIETNDMLANYQFYKKKNQELKNIAEASETWYGFEEQEFIKKAMDFFNCIRKLAFMCTLKCPKVKTASSKSIMEHKNSDESSDNLQ